MRERRSKVAIGDMLLPFQRPTHLQNENPQNRWFFFWPTGVAKIDIS